MRLHRLELTAFGPFGATQQVDFDRLTETGLFLLHGPTGAGKTSVLDAVSFALYGKVPGARGQGARLRSDHSPDGVVPEVVCELSVAGRRFEVTRNAEWLRPKRRGTGLIKEQSRVVLRELVAGEWRAVSNRIDETADLLQRLIGLGPDQFTKLVLLPQGEFATFLRAKPDDRKPLLQKLFGTDRFEAVEAWLVARRRELRLESEAARARTAQLRAKAEQAFLDVGWAGEGEEPSDDDGTLDLVTTWLDRARAVALDAHARVKQAEPADEDARASLSAGRRVLELQARREELIVRRSVLLAAADEQHDRRRRLELAAAAAAIAPVIGELDVADRTLVRAVRELATAQARVTPESGVADDRLAALHAEAGQVAELARVATQVAELDARIMARADTAAQARTDAEDLAEVAARLSDERAELVVTRDAAALLAAGLPDRERDLKRASDVARAVLERDRLTATLRAQEALVTDAFERYRAGAEAALEVRGRRLDGMAAELARRLSDGEPCPVCGADEHPAPARPGGDHVTEADELSATHRQDVAEQRLRTAEGEREQVSTALARIRVTAGELDAATAATRLAEADERRTETRQATEELALQQDRIQRVDAALTAGARGLARARTQVQQADSELTALVGSRSALDEQLGGLTAVQVQDRAAELAAQTAAWQQLATAEREHRAAADRSARLRAGATAAALQAGFDDLTAATAALLGPDQLARLRADVDAYERDSASVAGRLGDPELTAAGEHPAPDVPALTLASEAARERRRQAGETHLLATRAVSALRRLIDELEAHLSATRPLRERFAVVDSLARNVEGGGDNHLRMRLSAYVLAARLEQVAEAASHRLTAMTGGRFTLRHSDGPARGAVRSGLGLVVLDAWTGVERDPGTLSGGETFCTSLALALGLADVVSAEAGGMQLETLLVDEGFGSLDDETLELVLDVVDGLRSGGRAVGLVSHVADLKQRIPAQLEVVKTRTGSRLVQSGQR